jgi:hypothetical protein
VTVKTIKLNRGDRIVAVMPEYSAGPGWANQPVWVFIRQNDGTFREECIQPEERTAAMHTLFATGATVCAALVVSVPTKTKVKP